MTLQEQLTAFQKKRNDITARQEQMMQEAGDRTFDKDEGKEYDGLTEQLKTVDAHLERLRVVVGGEAGKTTEVENKGPTILVRKQDKDEDFPGQSFTRRVIARAVAQIDGFEKTAGQIAEERWGHSSPTLVKLIKSGYRAKANEVGAGSTTSGEWAAELVQADTRYTGDFIEFLKDKTIYDQLPLREVPAHVTIKGQDGTATGYWVGEGLAIPVSSQDYSSVTLSPSKVGAISFVTKELLRHSSPAAEALVRDALVDAIAQRVDSTFLGTAGASGATPAGILNGPSAINSNGTTAAALRTDIMELYSQFLTNKNATGLWLVMQPTLAKSISLLVNALGQTEFPGLNAGGGTLLGDPVVTGDNVTSGHMILLKPSDIYKIGDTGIEVSLSMDATLEANSVPAGDAITPTAAANTLMSMFQTESVAFKVTRPINFAKRRSHAAQYVVDGFYGIPDGTTA